MQAYSAPPQQGQHKRLPGAAPASSVEQVLLSSRTELRAVEGLLLSSDPRSPAGLLLSHFELLLTRLELGIAIDRSATLSLLAAASKVGPRTGRATS